jgi:hypothetical protein
MAKSPKAAAQSGGAISHVLLLADQAGFRAGSVLRIADPAPFPLDPEAVRTATQTEIDMASPSFLIDLVPPAAQLEAPQFEASQSETSQSEAPPAASGQDSAET